MLTSRLSTMYMQSKRRKMQILFSLFFIRFDSLTNNVCRSTYIIIYISSLIKKLSQKKLLLRGLRNGLWDCSSRKIVERVCKLFLHQKRKFYQSFEGLMLLGHSVDKCKRYYFKGQLITEWLFGVFNFPKKKTTQKCDEFLP
jgi:hypothetical protein